jgi:hypothetical protein
MAIRSFLRNPIIRNILGFLALLFIHFVSDRYSLSQRSGLEKTSPYLFLLLLYGWIVFHNRILFDRLYMTGKKVAYFSWTALAMTISSFNMYYILSRGFNVEYTLPHILSFWLYTITGLGVYVMFRYFNSTPKAADYSIDPRSFSEYEPADFSFQSDGEKQTLPTDTILYIESLENYIKIFSVKKTYIARLSLKDAEDSLSKKYFLRISRSQIVNLKYVQKLNGDILTVNQKDMKIGKVYKRYVEDQIKKYKLTSI